MNEKHVSGKNSLYKEPNERFRMKNVITNKKEVKKNENKKTNKYLT